MNIVIAGDGEVGLHLAQELSSLDNQNITIVDPHEDLLKQVESHTDLLAITGDSTSIETLKNANVKKADLLISVLHDERINLITAALGKQLGAKKTIARINNLEYLQPENVARFKNMGIDALVCPENIVSQEIATLLSQTAATEVFDFSDGKLFLFLIKLEENAPVVNKTLNDIVSMFPHLDFRAVAIHRNSKTIIPKGDDQFLVNDLSYVVTKPGGIDDLLKLGGKQRIDIRNVMIVGGGRVGRTTARKLESSLNIKLFEKDKQKSLQLASKLEHTLVINGDARDIQLMEDEDIRSMDAFIAVTDSSETNILACLHARKFGVKRTIALVENIDYIDISQNIGIDTIINKKLSTASYIVKYTMHAEVASIKCLSGINAEAMELVANPRSAVTRKPIKDLNMPKGAIIGGIIRGEDSHIAVGDFQIEEGDKVVVFSLPESIHKVDKLFNNK
ncbi:MAG: Trk system potassium transporter TrkA [Bacteroidetes bacterium]|nr:MAG: Trk system potassium transporter TrkA [Bacteroidota bacterium]RLD82815.1 MAG: Trk system potassium transporter TrkA [Bacteroidota bacterium]